MTLGEIKIESLRLMFAGNLGYGLNENGLNALLSDDNYNVYLYAMTGAINRCFADLESKGATPIKSMVLCRNKLADGVFDLTKIEEYSSLDSVTDKDGRNVEFVKKGNYLYPPPLLSDEDYCVIYYHVGILRIGEDTGNSEQIKMKGNHLILPDELARLIPYFIKGEVYREEDPNEAGEARNWYEQGVVQYLAKDVQTQNVIVSRYSMTI